MLIFNRGNSAVQGVDFGPIGGAGSVVQNGIGAVVLTTSNGYTGTTTINAGTLQLGAGVAGQDGSLTGGGGVSISSNAASSTTFTATRPSPTRSPARAA